MDKMKLYIKKLDDCAVIPTYGSSGAAGADLYSLPAPAGEDITLLPGETKLVHTGIAAAIPEGYVGLVCARSGLATKRGLAPANKVGVIDSDYRGEIMVALHNHGATAQTITAGDRIAQLLIMPVLQVELSLVDELDDTARGAGGFGSTGA